MQPSNFCNVNKVVATIQLLVVFSYIPKTEAYTAVVVDYQVINNKIAFPKDNIQSNLDEILKLIKSAADKKAEIIVFPEYGLTTAEIILKTPDHLDAYSVPNIRLDTTPCVEDHKYKPVNYNVISNLSCEARDSKITVVVSLVERIPINSEGNNYYLTAVVFNNEGKIISRYHKVHLNTGEEGVSKGEGNIDTFKPPFTETNFGILMTYDILYSNALLHDESVRDIIYSHAWQSEAPFLVAPSIQSGISKMYKKNLLASGYKEPKSKYWGGSGIYSMDGPMAVEFSKNKHSDSLMMNLNEPKNRAQPAKFIYDSSAFQKENMSGYHLKPLARSSDRYRKCRCKVCCEITFEMSGKPEYNYMFAAISGIRQFGTKTAGYMVCGVVACNGTDHSSCGLYKPNIESTATFTKLMVKIDNTDEHSKNQLYIPSTLNYAFQPLDSDAYDIIRDKDKSLEMKLKQNVNNLLTFAFVVRMTEYDDLPVSTFNDDDSCKVVPDGDSLVTIIVLAVVGLVVLLGAIIYFVWKRNLLPGRKIRNSRPA